MTTTGLLAIAVVMLISVLLGERTPRVGPSLREYFIADSDLKPRHAAHLLWASSLSLNGLLYHAWLGYKVGVYSLAIQAIWCSGFLVLGHFADRAQSVARHGTLPTGIARRFGPAAGIAAAIASLFGLISLAGWEMSIAASFAGEAFNASEAMLLAGCLIMALACAAYTVRGGLRGNLRANMFQNWLKLATLPTVIVASLTILFTESGQQPSLDAAMKWSLTDAALALGGSGALLSNAVFSLFWQTADMSTWQNIAATRGSGTNARKALRMGALGIFVSPGLVGTLLGMSLHTTSGLTEPEILPAILYAIGENTFVAALLLAGLSAAMLSTIDGLFLAASMTLVVDMTHRSTARDFIAKSPDSETSRSANARALSVAHIGTIVAALVAASMFLAVHHGLIGLFELVYSAVVGQMAICPCALHLLLRPEPAAARRSLAVWSIVAGLVAGLACVVAGVLQISCPFAPTWIMVAPLCSLGCAALTLLAVRTVAGR